MTDMHQRKRRRGRTISPISESSCCTSGRRRRLLLLPLLPPGPRTPRDCLRPNGSGKRDHSRRHVAGKEVHKGASRWRLNTSNSDVAFTEPGNYPPLFFISLWFILFINYLYINVYTGLFILNKPDTLSNFKCLI